MNKTNIDYWNRLVSNPSEKYQELFYKEKTYIRNNIKNSDKVLDVGCGSGRNILSILDITKNIVGIDIDEKAVNEAKKKLNDYPDIKIVQGSAFDLPFEDQEFDTAILSVTLVNFDDKKEITLAEMKRVIKDDGKLIVSVYSDKALEERLKMYKEIEVPIKETVGGKIIFDEGIGVSDQFSKEDINNLVYSVGLKIEDIEEVENLAYIMTLKK